jgi:tRNA (cytosine34-C5)-methyltransferase
MAVVNHNAKTLPRAVDEGARPDRVICDVPCSGDGTLRKNKGLLSHWQPHYGLQLHSTQIQIAMRGISLLKVGGLLAYSTCSLNPVENEAVVATLLAKCGAAVQLEDWRPSGLDTLQGFASWDVVDDTGMVFKTFDQAMTRSKPKSCRNRFRRSQWPPQENTIVDALKKCVRVVPSKGDTGGFFVALFRKVAEIPRAESAGAKKRAAKTDEKTSNLLKRHKVSRRLEAWIGKTPQLRVVSVGSTQEP